MLRHNDSAVISLPKNTEITLSEDNEGCRTTVRFGNGAEEECNSRQFVLSEPTDLTVTNTISGVIPTGVAGFVVPSVLLLMIPLFPIGCVLSSRKRRRNAA